MSWVSECARHLPYERLEARHVEALMQLKEDPSAANNVPRAVRLLYSFAATHLGHADTSTAKVDAKKANRVRLADSGFDKLTTATNVTNPKLRFGNQRSKSE